MSLLLYNAKIYTMNKNKMYAEAVYIEDDKIKKVGTNQEILAYKNEDTFLYDCNNKLVIPGLNDSHMHLYSFGLSLQWVHLTEAKSINDIITQVSNFIREKEVERGVWIRGRGWNQDYFSRDKRFPERSDLDLISKDHPIVLSRACGHVAVVNSKALEVCGIDEQTDQVEGGEFDLDKGIFRENALSLIFGKIPNPTLDEIKNTLVEAMKYANSQGLTSIQTDDLAHLPNEDFKLMLQAYNELRKENKLTCRIYQQCLLNNIDKLTQFLNLGYYTGYGDEYFKIGPLKLLSDGSLGARTAAMMKPYADDPTTSGIMCYSQEELDDLIMTAHNNKMQVAVHCIGDRSMYMVFNSIEKALKQNKRDNHRHSIIHCQITDEILLNKYKEFDVLALVQPIFLHYDLHIVESRVGKELAYTSYAYKSMIDKGIHVAFGTDCPVEPLDTMPNLYCAVTREDLSGYPQGGWNPKERVTIEEALYHYTVGSAYASFEEEVKGSIVENQLADLIVLSDDLLTIEPSEIKKVNVELTVLGGKIVYQKS